MREFTVRYLISDEMIQRLENITDMYRKSGFDLTEESVFEMIMTSGSQYDIDEKFRFHERKSGLQDEVE